MPSWSSIDEQKVNMPDGCAPAVVGVFVGGVLVFGTLNVLLSPTIQEAYRLKQEAIEKGYAEHNPKTGVWEWKEKP